MKKSLLIFSFLLIASAGFSQCVKLKDMTSLLTKSMDAQEKYLKKKGFKKDANSFMPESFGWDYKNSTTNTYINIKWEGKDVTMIQYRLLADQSCFNSIYNEGLKIGFTKNYQKITESTTYQYYKTDKYGLETAEWMSGGEKYFQYNLINIKYYEKLKHQWDEY